jgi:5-methyltetrahydropteroyltriglutamate--homocysteine methyltransferase
MTLATNLGFPRIGARRELKHGLEAHWRGDGDAGALRGIAKTLRAEHWLAQRDAGLDHVPSNDFSLYDHVLDTAVMVGAVPERYRWRGGSVDLATYFAMARGAQSAALDVPAMEMTKWFDTNYHYLVPEFSPGQRFELASTKPIDEFAEAAALGVHTRPVLLGPISFLLLGKAREHALAPLALLPDLVPVYGEVLRRLSDAGADWVQIDEPCLALDLDAAARTAYGEAYATLVQAAPGLSLLLAAYFEGLRDNLDTAMALPVAAVHFDLVRAPDQLDAALDLAGDKMLSLGVVDGRNIWRADLGGAFALLETAAARIGADKVMVAPSCSMLHAPFDLDLETKFDGELKSWLAFAKQKLGEIAVLTKGLGTGRGAIADALAASDAAAASRRDSTRIHDSAVAERLSGAAAGLERRHRPRENRLARQGEALGLPAFPTTTIGSFPQTAEVRAARLAFRRGERDQASYDTYILGEIEKAVHWQEEIGLDVLVHGEFERNDMVQYFAELLQGFAVMQNGWVQSYGSRCVKPPIIYGDVARPRAMTVKWSVYAQSLTGQVVKGMLTGPVTMMQWAYVRDDQPREATCRQIALALRDEVADLEGAGIRIVQIDEPALREGLPLRHADHPRYLDWAVACFRLASSGVGDETQIHTHMCYSEFNEIIAEIGALDADVISIETSRSQMELLDAFGGGRWSGEVGPGVYDIHAPRVPSVDEMVTLLHKAAEKLSPEQIWVNPDCGLKTRGWEEVRPALANMVAAAKRARADLGGAAES